MSKFLADKYQTLDVYTPGEQPQDMEYIKLNTNESPYPPAPQVTEAITAAEIENLKLYSDPDCTKLKNKLAKTYDVAPENIFLSNGSDDILNFAFMAFASKNNKVYFPEISYGFYPVFGDLYKLDVNKIPLKEDFSIDFKDYLNLDGMIVIANPNAPTGLVLSLDEIEEILKTNPENVVLIDEAYVDFGAESALPLLDKYENLLIVQTYSKSRSLAGARLGFAIANKDLIDDLNRIKYSTNPYNVNRLTLLAGEAALDAPEYFKENCKKIAETRQFATDELEKIGFRVIPSKANFIFVESDKISGDDLYDELKSRGILIRHFNNEKIKNFNRITIGTREQMEKLIETVKEILL